MVHIYLLQCSLKPTRAKFATCCHHHSHSPCQLSKTWRLYICRRWLIGLCYVLRAQSSRHESRGTQMEADGDPEVGDEDFDVKGSGDRYTLVVLKEDGRGRRCLQVPGGGCWILVSKSCSIIDSLAGGVYGCDSVSWRSSWGVRTSLKVGNSYMYVKLSVCRCSCRESTWCYCCCVMSVKKRASRHS